MQKCDIKRVQIFLIYFKPITIDITISFRK